VTRKKQGKILSVAEIKKQYDAKVVVELPLVRRAAHFFDWAAVHYPKQWVPWNWTLQAILGQARTPKQDAHAVLALRSTGSRIRQILQLDYQRDFTVGKGLGARATVDSEDTLKTQGVKTAIRIRGAVKAAQKTLDLINPKQIPDTAENKPWKRWLSRSLRDAMKEIGSATFERKLLAPGEEKPKPTKKKK
jgi:hypothetical protein